MMKNYIYFPLILISFPKFMLCILSINCVIKTYNSHSTINGTLLTLLISIIIHPLIDYCSY